MLDQPAGLLRRMMAALNVYQVLQAYRTLEAVAVGEWIETHPDAYRLMQDVKRVRDGRY